MIWNESGHGDGNDGDGGDRGVEIMIWLDEVRDVSVIACNLKMEARLSYCGIDLNQSVIEVSV